MKMIDLDKIKVGDIIHFKRKGLPTIKGLISDVNKEKIGFKNIDYPNVGRCSFLLCSLKSFYKTYLFNL